MPQILCICDFSWCWKGDAVPTAVASASREMAKSLSENRPVRVRLGGQPASTESCVEYVTGKQPEHGWRRSGNGIRPTSGSSGASSLRGRDGPRARPGHWRGAVGVSPANCTSSGANVSYTGELTAGELLMLRYRHRFSRDIDLFVPDPQYLGFVTPRLSEAAESITSDYVEQGPVWR